MAGPKGSKYYDIFLKYSIWLARNEGQEILSNEFFGLLKSIEKEGSIVAAAEKMDISFRKAWQMVKQTENNLNFKLIICSRGGQNGGKSVLTEDGYKLLNAYNELVTEFDNAIHNVTRKFFHTINQ